jgi:hypothetical protein
MNTASVGGGVVGGGGGGRGRAPPDCRDCWLGDFFATVISLAVLNKAVTFVQCTKSLVFLQRVHWRSVFYVQYMFDFLNIAD